MESASPDINNLGAVGSSTPKIQVSKGSSAFKSKTKNAINNTKNAINSLIENIAPKMQATLAKKSVRILLGLVTGGFTVYSMFFSGTSDERIKRNKKYTPRTADNQRIERKSTKETIAEKSDNKDIQSFNANIDSIDSLNMPEIPDVDFPDIARPNISSNSFSSNIPINIDLPDISNEYIAQQLTEESGKGNNTINGQASNNVLNKTEDGTQERKVDSNDNKVDSYFEQSEKEKQNIENAREDKKKEQAQKEEAQKEQSNTESGKESDGVKSKPKKQNRKDEESRRREEQDRSLDLKSEKIETEESFKVEKNNNKKTNKNKASQLKNPEFNDLDKKKMENLGSMFVVKSKGASSSSSSSKRNQSASVDNFIFIKGETIPVQDSDSATAKTERSSNLENTIQKGKIIDIVLETAINSEIPGNVRGIVSRNVMGEIGNNVLIPRGTRVYGTYSSAVARGQSRLAIIWNKILRPDGVSVSINAYASDKFGRSGIEGDVDNRYKDMFLNSLLLSFVTLGTSVALSKITDVAGQSQIVNNNGSVATTNITPENYAAQNLVQTAADIAKKMTEGALNINAVISLKQGERLKMAVNQEIVLPTYEDS